MQAPVPYELSSNGLPEDGWDKNIPLASGFISDFVYSLRGTAVSTMYCVWGAIWAMSTVMKRDAWIKWFPRALYCNIYVILVGLPSISKKGTLINNAAYLVEQMEKYLQNDNKKITKEMNIIRNQATSQFMIDEMVPKVGFGKGRPLWILDAKGKKTDEMLKDESGDIVYYRKTSNVAIVAPELSVLLGKEKFNTGLIDFLTNIYDAEDKFDSGRRGTGKQELRDLYVTFIGGTTPTHMQESIPSAAMGDGFVSRTVMPYLDGIGRRKSKPEQIEGAPDRDEMAKRLAWIADNMEGEYELCAEANKFYEKFYTKQMDRIEKYPELSGVIGRSDTTLLQLSLLMKAQRYSAGGKITIEDIVAAERILSATAQKTADILNLVSGGEEYRLMKDVARYVEKQGSAKRPKLLSSNRSRARDIDNALGELSQRGMIKIKVGNRIQKYPTRSTSELYEWSGDKKGMYGTEETDEE